MRFFVALGVLVVCVTFIGCGPQTPAIDPAENTTAGDAVATTNEAEPKSPPDANSQPAVPMPDAAVVAKVAARVEELGAKVTMDEAGVPVAIDFGEPGQYQTDFATNDDVALFCEIKTLRRLRIWSRLADDAAVDPIVTLPRLEHLGILSSNLTDAALKPIAGMPNLTVLDLRRCVQITDAGLVHLAEMTQLKSLKLQSPGITNQGLKTLQPLTSLKALALEQSAVNDEGLPLLAQFPQVVDFSLLECGEVTDAGLVHLAKLPRLRQLNLRATPIDGSGLAVLKELPELAGLNLSQTQLGDDGLAHLATCVKMKKLQLWQTNVSSAGLAPLAGLKELEELRLDNNFGIDDAAAEHLAKLTSLTKLNLENTLVSDTGLAQLKTLKNLRQLNVMTTQVTDAGVADFLTAVPECEVTLRPDAGG
jgi:internalin A